MKWILVLRFLRKLGGAGKDVENETLFSWKPRALYAGMGAFLLVLACCSAAIAGLAWGSSRGLAVGMSVVVAWLILMVFLQWSLGLFVHEARGRGVAHLLVAMTLSLGIGILVSWMNTMLLAQVMYKADISQEIEADFRHDRNTLQQKQDALLAQYSADLAQKRSAAGAVVAKAAMGGNTEIANLQAARAKHETELDKAMKEQNAEATGRRAKNSQGCGTICKTMEGNILRLQGLVEQAKKDLEAAQTRQEAANRGEIDTIRTILTNDEVQLKADYEAANKRIVNDIADLEAIDRYGFYNMQQAVLKLYVKNPTAIVPMQALFLFIEIAFIALTLAFSGNEYASAWRVKDKARREEEAKQEEEVAKSRRARQLQTRIEEVKHRSELEEVERGRLKGQLEELDIRVQGWKAEGKTDAEVAALRREWMKGRKLHLVGS